MKTITLTSTDKKIDPLLKVAKEMGVEAKPFRELTDEEMALPGPKVSKEQLEDWLVKEDGEVYSSAQVKARIKGKLAKSKKK